MRAESVEAATEAKGQGEQGNFAEAMAMLSRLPLTDQERAEAVRRLLGVMPRTEGVRDDKTPE